MGLAAGDFSDQAGREAFAFFYKRHSRWLFRELSRRHASKLVDWEDGIEDVVTDTFQRAFRGADTYKTPEGVTDPKSLERLARGWLGQIGNRAVADVLRLQSRELLLEPDELQEKQVEIEKAELASGGEEDEAETPLVSALREELRQLSPIKQDVMAAVEHYFEPAKGKARMSRGAAQALADKWGSKPETIRQIRKRTLDELRSKLEAYLED